MSRKQSFISIPEDSDFPIQNLPYGVFSTADNQAARVGVALGEWIVDLAVLEQQGLLPTQGVFNQKTLNPFIELGIEAWHQVRAALTDLLDAETATLRDNPALREQALVKQADAQMHLPIQIPGYTDFYSSKEHAYNVGCMFRDPKNALMQNWTELPVGYNGRASTVVVSGTDVVRPSAQIKLPDQERPVFSACRKLDFELETGFIIGVPTRQGQPIDIQNAEQHIFGMVLLNDWSARDIQQWEYVPLGPFNSKTFSTSISPWVVTMAALEAFRVDGPAQDPVPLAYLQDKKANTFDIQLEVAIETEDKAPENIVSNTNFKHMYWSMAQQLSHHTIAGCNVNVGDLMGSGTISGATKNSFGSLLEITWNASEPLTFSNGEERTFLKDGDTVIMRGHCQGEHYRIGFGEVRGKVLPAVKFVFQD